MKLWKTLAVLAISVEAARRGNKNRNQDTTTTSTTITSTTVTTTTFTTDEPLTLTEKNFQGEFTDAQAGTIISATRNVDGSITILVRNDNRLIIAFDTATIVNDSTGRLNFVTAGGATFDNVTGQIIFDNGMQWQKTDHTTTDTSGTTSGTTDTSGTSTDTSGTTTDTSGSTTTTDTSSGTATGTDTSGTTTTDTSSGTTTDTSGTATGTTTDTSGTTGTTTDTSGTTTDTSGTSTTNTAGTGTTGTDTSGTSTTNTAGTGTTSTDAYGNGTGYVQGDPHVRIQLPGEQPICYDIEAEVMDYVSLIDDEGIDLEVNGRIEHIKESKNRLAEIGFQTKAGVQIAIDDKRVRIGMDGTFDNEYDFDEYQKLHIEDVTVEIFTPYEGKHNSVAVELDSGAQFMISSKSSRPSISSKTRYMQRPSSNVSMSRQMLGWSKCFKMAISRRMDSSAFMSHFCTVLTALATV